ncbi:MAG TPA: RluA family pseudouridine synthase [Polyangiaceae bacterium]
MSHVRRFRLGEDHAGRRLDHVVRALIPELSGRRARAIFEQHDVMVEGRRARKGEPARAGDTLVVRVPPRPSATAEADLPLDVRLERYDLIVVSKPAGQATCPTREHPEGSLAGALLARFPELSSVGEDRREPGLLHRLDTETSGLLVVARNQSAFTALRDALRGGLWQKRYLAIVEGRVVSAQGEIALALRNDRRRPERVEVGALEGVAPRTTRYRVLEQGAARTLLELEVARAFRHQVRAHLSAIGHPIVGDAVYGAGREPGLGARHALHASYVACSGARGVAAFVVETPLPAELAALLGR